MQPHICTNYLVPHDFFSFSPLCCCHDDIWSNHMVFKVLYFKSSAFHVVSFQIRTICSLISMYACQTLTLCQFRQKSPPPVEWSLLWKKIMLALVNLIIWTGSWIKKYLILFHQIHTTIRFVKAQFLFIQTLPTYLLHELKINHTVTTEKKILKLGYH